MDWNYKHFNKEAVFMASVQSVLEAARAVVAESLEVIEDKPDGFVARGRSGWHAEDVTFRVTPAPNGTQVAVELLVKRTAMGGYMLADIGGYYNGQIDKWFLGIAQRLGSAHEQILVSKTTSSVKVMRGCLAGFLACLIVGACLGSVAIPLDLSVFPQSSGPFQGPFSLIASIIGFVAFVAAFVYAAYPEAAASKAIRERLQRFQNKERQ